MTTAEQHRRAIASLTDVVEDLLAVVEELYRAVANGDRPSRHAVDYMSGAMANHRRELRHQEGVSR